MDVGDVFGLEQENLPHASQDRNLAARLSELNQLSSRSSFSLDTKEFSHVLGSVETSLKGLRQEVDAVKQLRSSQTGSSPQQQHHLSTQGGEDLLHGFAARLSTPIRRSTLAATEASTSRRSSLGLRFQPACDGGSYAGGAAASAGTVEERIYAGIASALKAAAAAQRTPTKAAAASQAAAQHVASPSSSPLQHNRSGQLIAAAAAAAAAAAMAEAAGEEYAEPPSASTVAAAMQELAAATAAEQTGQQLQQQIQQLKREVEELKQAVSTQLGSEQQEGLQQLQEQQQQLQQALSHEAGAWQARLEEQQQLVSGLTAELQQFRQQQQQQEARPASPPLDDLLADLRQQAQEQIARMGRQQEERVGLLLDDLREELLDRLDGIQLRLQSVEEEQERFGDRQQQQRKQLQLLQAAAEQQQPCGAAAGAPMQRASSGRQRVSAGPAVAAAAPAPGRAHTDNGAVCALPPGFAVPEMSAMLPTSISEPDPPEAQHSKDGSAILPAGSILEQQRPPPAAAQASVGAGSDLHASYLLSASQSGRTHLAEEVADLADRVRQLEQQQQGEDGVSARLQALEEQQGAAMPLDAMTCGAVEVRLSVLEDDSGDAKRQLQEASEQLMQLCEQLASLQEQLEGHEGVLSDPAAAVPGDAELAARVTELEAEQQRLKEQQERLAALQQQVASRGGSSVSIGSQPSSVKERIQQFEDQLNAAIRRFAPGHVSSRPNSEGGMLAAGGAGEVPPLCLSRKNPGRESSLRELLANLQADVEQLLSSAPVSARSAGDKDSDSPCCTDGSAGSAAADDAGFVLAGQLQHQLARLTQNCAELGEAVLQLDVQMQQVEERVKQQRQQTLTATQSATAATYISKEAAHEIERVTIQVQQLAAAVKGGTNQEGAVAGVDAASAGQSGPAAAAQSPAVSTELAEQVQRLGEAMEQLKQQTSDSAQQLQQQAEAHHRQGAAAADLAQELAEAQQQVTAMEEQLGSYGEAQQQCLQQQQEQAAATGEHSQQLVAIQQLSEQQGADFEALKQQLKGQEALQQQLQEAVQELPRLKQQLELVTEQLAAAATASAQQQEQQAQLETLQRELLQLSDATSELQRQLEAQASAAAAVAAVQQQQSDAHARLSAHEAQADELSGLLFSLRVDLQNGLQEVGERLQGVEGLRGDMDIWQDSMRAAGARTEAAATDALEKVEALVAAAAAQQTQQADAAAGDSTALQAQLQELQQQLEPLPPRLEALQQQLLDTKQELQAQLQGDATGVQQRLDDSSTQLQQLQEQLQQMQTDGRQVQQQLEQKLDLVQEDLQSQLLAHGGELQQHSSQLEQQARSGEQLQQQVVQTQSDLAGLRSALDSQTEDLAQQQPLLQALEEQVQQLQQQLQQQQQELPVQLQQLSQQFSEVQVGQAAQVDSREAQVSQLSSLQEQLQSLQQQVSDGQAQVLPQLQEAQQRQQQLQQQLDALAAAGTQLEQRQAEQLSAALQPLREQQAALQQQQHQQQEETATGLQQRLSGLDTLLQGLEVQVTEAAAEAQQSQQQLQQQLDALTAAGAQLEQRQAEQLSTALQPLREQQAALQQQHQQQEERAMGLQQRLSELDTQLQGLAAQVADAAAQAEQWQQLDQELEKGLQQTLAGQLQDAQAQLQEQVAQSVEVQAKVAELSAQTQQLQEQAAQSAEVQAQVAELSAQTQQQAAQSAKVQAQVAELSAQAQQLQEQLQQAVPPETVQQLEGDVRALQAQLQLQGEQVQQSLQQQAQDVWQAVDQQLQGVSQLALGWQEAAASTAAHHAQQLQQHAQQLDGLQGQQQEQQAVLTDLQRVEGQQTAKLQQLSDQQGQQAGLLTAVQLLVQQGADKLEGVAQLQEQQQQVLTDVRQQQALTDVRQQQDQGVQELQQLHAAVEELGAGVAKAAADAEAATSAAAGAEKQMAELRLDLEEALGFMAPFLSPAASSLTSPGATPFTSPLRRHPGTGLYETFSAAAAAHHSQSPFGTPGGSCSVNPMHVVGAHAMSSAGVPGYSLTIDIGTQLPGRGPLVTVSGPQALQQQQSGMTEVPGSAAASRQVSAQDSAGALSASYLPLSAGLWRPEPHLMAPVVDAAAAQGPAAAADAAAAGAGDAAAAAATPVAARLSRFDAQATTPGSPGKQVVRCASLDSPSFRAAVVAGIGYGPTPPSHPSPTGVRPFRGQLAPAGSAAAGAAGDSAAGPADVFKGEQDLGLFVTPASTGSAGRTGGSSAGRLLRTGSLDSPSFVAAATAGQAYERTPVQSGGGGGVCRGAGTGGASRFAGSLNVSDAALRLFDALGEPLDATGADTGAMSAQGEQQQQQQLQPPAEDDSPEHQQQHQRRLPGGVAAAALVHSLQRASHSTAEGIGSLRSSAVWSGRDSAMFDNSLYNTPRKRRKSKAAIGAAAASAAAAGTAAAAGGTGEDADGDVSDAFSSDSEGGRSGLVSLTDSLTVLQLRRLQQQHGAAVVVGGMPMFGEPSPVTPTVAVSALAGSSSATTATPVSVYKNAMFEDGGRRPRGCTLPAGAFSGGGVAAARASHPGLTPPAGPPAAAATAAAAGVAAAAAGPADVYATPAALTAESSAADAAAAAMAVGRSLSPAEAVATVRNLTTPPSLGSWQKKRRQQQQRQGRQSDPADEAAAAQQQQQRDGEGGRGPGSCDFAAGPAAGDSPAMLLRDGRQQPMSVLSAEVLAQHTAASQQQQQQGYGDMQGPWLQQHAHQQQQGVARGGPGSPPVAFPSPRDHTAARGTPEAALSPMLSELLSLGADVIDLEGSEADSDLLTVTPDRSCSKTGGAGLQAGSLEALSRQLLFGGAGEGGVLGQQDAAAAAPGAVAADQPAGCQESTSRGQLGVPAPHVQQQQQGAAHNCTNSTPGSRQPGPAAAVSPGGAAPGSNLFDAVGAEAEDEPVLRLRGGGGYEPHHDADVSTGGGSSGWQLGREDSFDLADYGSSDDEGAGSVCDGYSDEAWELVQAPADAGAATRGSSAAAGSGSSANTAAAAAAAGGGSYGGLVQSAKASAIASSSAGSGGLAAARGGKGDVLLRPPIPQGWLRAVPPGWVVGAAPPEAYRVALRTSSKTGSGTKTRATLSLTGQSSSSGSSAGIRCEHKLGGGRKRCSYVPGSTVQDWLQLSAGARSSSSAGGGSAQAAAVASGVLPVGVSQVSVRHDAAGFSGAWLLECVVVQHLRSGDWWQFDNRGSWVKGTQQAKAVAARDAEGQQQQPAPAATSSGDSTGKAQAMHRLHLSSSGVAANCPLDPMPCSSLSDSSSSSAAEGAAAPATLATSAADAAAVSAAAAAAAAALGATASAAAVAGPPAADGSSSNSRGDSIIGAAGGFVPLDDVELKLRGSPCKGPSSRSCSPSPTHKARHAAQQQHQDPQQLPAHDAPAGGGTPSAQPACSSPAAAASIGESGSLRSIAAMVSRAAAPAAAAVTAAAWDVLGSRRSSAGELRGAPAGRRVSGSIAPAKLVPLLSGRSSSSSGGGSSGEQGAAGALTGLASGRDSSEGVPGGGDGTTEAGLGLSCRVSRNLTHSLDGTPCRLVRCSSSYLGRNSSGGASPPLADPQRGVHFLEFAEQVEFDAAAAQTRRNGPGSSGTSSSSSIQSFTEEQLLEAQGGWEFVRPPESGSSYTTLIDTQPWPGATPTAAAANGATGTRKAAPAAAEVSGTAGGSGEFQEVPLVGTKPGSLVNKARGGGSEYQLRIHTADRIGAALPSGQQVFVEVLGSTGSLLTTQLPRPKGSFLRGCCDSFSLSSAAGDIGRIEALRVWHEPGGGAIGGSWCLQRVDVEAVFRGVTYVFTKAPQSECWVGRGLERAVVLTQPQLLRSDDSASLLAEAAELQRQLDSNAALEAGDREVLASRLQKLQLRLAASG